MLKKIILHKIGFEWPHHLVVFPPHNLHYSYCSKVQFLGPAPLKFWGKMQKVSTKVTLQATDNYFQKQEEVTTVKASLNTGFHRVQDETNEPD